MNLIATWSLQTLKMVRSLCPLLLLFFFCFISVSVLANNSHHYQQPTIPVQGRVVNARGEPLPGATVSERGTANVVATRTDGGFAIAVSDTAAVLAVSYVGYQTREISVGAQTSITVTLTEGGASLADIVVVGYGTQRRREVTGSVSTVRGEELARLPNTNPISSLQGKVAGLTIANSGQAGISPVVRVRGINSTNNSNVLYVVDGIFADNIDFLNPADIESIDVLRDPSSIAIYGLRGANGVIAVTTRKAARGQTRVSFQSSVGIQHVTDKVDVTDAAGFKRLYNQQLANQGAALFDTANVYTGNTNWQDEVLRNALININSLTISSGSERGSTLLTLGYTNQEGVVKYDKYERYLVRINQEIRFNKNIRVGGDVTGYHYRQNPPGVSLSNALWAAPVIPIQYDENTYYSLPVFQRAQVGNPVATLRRNNRTSLPRGYRVIGNIFAEIRFLQHFTLRSTVYADLSFNSNRGYTPLAYRFINLGENGAATTFTVDPTIRTGVSQEQTETRRFQQDHTLTYDRRFGNKHSITALAGFTTIYDNSVFLNANRSDTTVNVPNNPNLFYINAINQSNPGTYGGGGGESSVVGAFARASYAFEGKYLVNATIRRDASSKFAPGNRWGTFGSVGVGYVISDETFFEKVKGINFLKLRGAYGTTGNANGVPDNLYEPGVSNAINAVFGNNVYTAIQAAYVVDPNLHWEVVRGLDLGFDLRILDNRLNAEVTFYNRRTTDILTAITLLNDPRQQFTNLGKITNKGIEITLGWNDRIGKDITYSFSPNFSYNRNRVNAIGNNIGFNLVGNSGANLTQTGYSIGYFYGYEQTGIYQTTADIGKMPSFANSLPGDISYRDVNGDGVLNAADRTYLGTPFPPYNFGFNFTFGYRAFDLIIDGQGVAGNKIYAQRRTANFAVLNFESNRLNAWTGPGTTNVEPIADNSRGNNYLFSSYFLEPGDYFRVRNIQIGYNVKPGILSKAGVQRARIYLSGQNVKTWSQVTGYTPEPQIGSILAGGADNGVYPVPAVYAVGINVTFQ